MPETTKTPAWNLRWHALHRTLAPEVAATFGRTAAAGLPYANPGDMVSWLARALNETREAAPLRP